MAIENSSKNVSFSFNSDRKVFDFQQATFNCNGKEKQFMLVGIMTAH